MVVCVQRSKVFLAMFLAVLLAGFAHAASFGVTINSIDSSILRNESATFEVVISNFGSQASEFQIYTIDPAWIVKTDPLALTVESGSQKTMTLSLRPTSAASYGTQGVNINIKDLASGSVNQRSVILSLKNPDQAIRDYLPTVAIDILMPYEIDPRSPIPLRIDLRNRNPLNISNVTVLIESPHFSTSTMVNLGPLSERTVDIKGLSMPSTTAPAEAEVSVKLLYQGETVTAVTKNYKVKEYTKVDQEVQEQSFFFKTEKTIKITNVGNVKNNAIVSVPTSFIKSLFISSSLPYEHDVRDGQRVIYWSIPLDPYGTKTFSYTENYRILVLLVLLLLIGGITYLLLRSPVIAIKEAVAVAHADGVSDIKVRVFVRNRSSKMIQGLQVIDRVPSIADVVKASSPGSLAPSKVATSEKQGTLLRWELEVLEPFEERILTYHLKSKLKIIGRMTLPNARIRFTFSGKERAVYSNNIELVEKFRDK